MHMAQQLEVPQLLCTRRVRRWGGTDYRTYGYRHIDYRAGTGETTAQQKNKY